MDMTDCLVSCTCGREPSPISQTSKFYLPVVSSPQCLTDCMMKQTYSGPSKTECSLSVGKNEFERKPNQRIRARPRENKAEEKSFDCRVCERVFPTQSLLDKHIRNHDEYRPHKCPMCNKGFKQPSHLQQHLRTHSDERPFPCDICNKSFKQSCQLKQHVRLHTEEKPYQCPECDRSFKQASHLNQHVRLHTGEKPYKCQHCDRTFTQASQLRSHKKTHEPKSERKGAGRKPKPLGVEVLGGPAVAKPINIPDVGFSAPMISPRSMPNTHLNPNLQSLKNEPSYHTKSQGNPFMNLGTNLDGSTVRVVHVAELPVSTIVPHI